MVKKILHQIDPKFSKIICLAINYLKTHTHLKVSFFLSITCTETDFGYQLLFRKEKFGLKFECFTICLAPSKIYKV